MLERLNELSPFSKATAIHDNGCGPGLIISRLIGDYGNIIPADCKLSASDFSAPMIEQINKTKSEETQADSKSPWNRVEASVIDATNLSSIADDSFSHMTAGWVFLITSDPMACLTESRRVLKDHGVLACSSWKYSKWMDLMADITHFRPNVEIFDFPVEWKSTEGLKGEMEKAGFRDVEAQYVEVELTFDTRENLVDMMMNKMPHIITMISDFSPEERQALQQRMMEHVNKMTTEEPGSLSGMASVAFGRK